MAQLLQSDAGQAADEDLGSVARALAWATGRLRATSASARLDAELLLAHALGWGRARVLAEGAAALPEASRAAFRALVERRAALEPVAYLLGRREFYGLDLLVDRRVLVPRPETELLIDLALELVRRTTNDERRTTNDERRTMNDQRSADDRSPDTQHSALDTRHSALDTRHSILGTRHALLIADIGTGSGAIAVALATRLPTALIYAIDLSPEALEVAGLNVARHGVAGRVRLLAGDLLEALPEPVDLIVSNPPYTVLSEIEEGVRRHEPRLALDGGADGLALYRRLLAQAPAWLRPGGALLLEIGATQGAAVLALARERFPAARIELHRDLAGRDRVVAVLTGAPGAHQPPASITEATETDR